MTVGDIITRAINEYYNNPGTSNDSLTPVMVAHWIEKSLIRYWGKINDNNFGYFSSRENVLNVTTASNIYTMPNGNSSVTQFTFSGTPVSGSFIFYAQMQNGSSATITATFNETASALQTALNLVFSPNGITVTGGPIGTTTSIAWNTYLTNFTITTNTLKDVNGNSVTVTPITSNLNVQMVTAMAVRTGSAPNYQYNPLGTFFPNAKYGYPNSGGNGINQYIYGSTGNPMSWCFESGQPDPFTQLPTCSVRFAPWPAQSFTIVYDCIRYPNKIMFDNSTIPQPITTQEIDLPRHFHDGVVMDVLIEAYTRMKADCAELIQMRDTFDKSQFNIEMRNLQRQGPDTIQIVDGDGYGGY